MKINEVINNVKVFGLEDSIRASKYPMSVNVNNCTDEMTPTVKSLGNCKMGTGHDQFLTGIVVQFDLTFSLKAWTEAQRYHFLDFVSSQSTMHRISKMDIVNNCNPYVTREAIGNLLVLVRQYNDNPTTENYLKVLYNIPTGFELTARMTTNYRQLKTIYNQRKNHRLPEWRIFCEWILTLPYFKNLCVQDGEENELTI